MENCNQMIYFYCSFKANFLFKQNKLTEIFPSSSTSRVVTMTPFKIKFLKIFLPYLIYINPKYLLDIIFINFLSVKQLSLKLPDIYICEINNIFII